MQKAQESYHIKRTSAVEFCGLGDMSLEHMDLIGHLNVSEWVSIRDKSQITLNGCKSKATQECKAAALDHVLNLAELFNDKDLPKCYNTSMITFGPTNNRLNDFFMFTRKDWVKATPLKIGPLVENFESSCK